MASGDSLDRPVLHSMQRDKRLMCTILAFSLRYLYAWTGSFVRRGGRAILVLGLASAIGCDELKRESASGAVTWQGRPLVEGRITFTPSAGEAVPVGGVITDGRYVLPNPPGLAPGEYTVRIFSRGGGAGERPRVPLMDFEHAQGGEQIPQQYNDRTTLKAQVTAGGSNTFDFDLTGTRNAPKQPGGRMTKGPKPRGPAS